MTFLLPDDLRPTSTWMLGMDHVVLTDEHGNETYAPLDEAQMKSNELLRLGADAAIAWLKGK
jgi:hypothetical protein